MPDVIYLVAAPALLLALELVYFALARRLGIVDRPNERSSHHSVVLRGGGIIFFLALPVYFVFHATSPSLPDNFLYMLAGATLLAVVCMADDVKGVPSWLRLVAQIMAVVFSFYGFLVGIEAWKLLLVVIAFVAVLNVYNFMDGLNGMLSLYTLVVLLTLAAANRFEFAFVDPHFLYAMIVAVAVFGFFNCRRRARCFSGDVGSVVLGLVVLYLLVLYVKGQVYSGVAVSSLTLIIVFLADGLLTIMKRFLAGKNIFQPHREHLYETLANDLHVPHLWVSAIYAALQAAINVGYFFVPDRNMYVLVCAVLLTLAYGLFFFFYNRYLEALHTSSQP